MTVTKSYFKVLALAVLLPFISSSVTFGATEDFQYASNPIQAEVAPGAQTSSPTQTTTFPENQWMNDGALSPATETSSTHSETTQVTTSALITTSRVKKNNTGSSPTADPLKISLSFSSKTQRFYEGNRLVRVELNDTNRTVLTLDYDASGLLVRAVQKSLLQSSTNSDQIIYHFKENQVITVRNHGVKVQGLINGAQLESALFDKTYASRFTVSMSELSPYTMPPSAKAGGVDVNILDWKVPTIANATITGYSIARREVGSTTWIAYGSAGTLNRFMDADAQTGKLYEYQVTVQTSIGVTQVVSHVRSANFEEAYQGPRAANVLVLINANAPGYVNLSEAVEGYETANGKLDPYSESDLLKYLGADGAQWSDADGDGVYYLGDWKVRKDTRSGQSLIEVPLGIYYAMRRGIPLANIMILNDIPIQERDVMTQAVFQEKVVNPVANYLRSRGLEHQIMVVSSIFHFPLTVDSISWDEALAYNLSQAIYSRGRVSYDSGHAFSRALGDAGYMATRIDAADAVIARRMVDDAIWAEENYDFSRGPVSDLRAYIDWDGPYDVGDGYFQKAAQILGSSGLFGEENEGWTSAANLDAAFIAANPQFDLDQDGKLDATFFRVGWYDVLDYQDIYEFARGAVAWNLDSYSAYTFRDNLSAFGSSQGEIWGPNLLSRGVVATLGAVNEPYLAGYEMPQKFTHYLLGGYSFAEAAYLGSPGYGGKAWMMSYNGDALYRPYDRTRQEPLIENGVRVGTRVLLTMGGELVASHTFPAYRDYDLQGKLIREQLPNGQIIDYRITSLSSSTTSNLTTTASEVTSSPSLLNDKPRSSKRPPVRRYQHVGTEEELL